ncbi:MAG: (4Fe-4S)-binding protein [Prevotellaceae bacterium]|jgi:uncharacterized Fe-S cluster protein YjdI|nr:(4Fe-4S)-binding protein [Prevotellaceae bacterium]
MEMKKEYAVENLTIVWQPRLCIHSGICVHTLPCVYRVGEKPWIQPEHATVEELMQQIDRCPSGALSYRLSGKS